VNKTREELSGEVTPHAVGDPERAALLHTLQGRVDLDDGERDLLSFALTLTSEVWWLCGPDKATIYAMHLLGIMDRMCSLQALAQSTGINLAQTEIQYTEKWLSSMRTQLLLTGKLN